MRRTLAIALAAGLLFLGGCGRGRTHQPATAPPPATTATTAPAGQQAPGNGDEDVDRLLDQVGQQLSKDAQAPEDED
ncbi:hypothetical protein ABT369_43950 [Dactylosporangium sp. NPDC000244]|uniref:hypothetical protein n=1 Tax=Dactylosporangium sp. NPDC000244 TaxID=3154365 RepID=UPI003329F53F